MNNIGIGIFCFGSEKYFKGTYEKIDNFISHGVSCYVYTDNPQKFEKYNNDLLYVIPYYRTVRSYHDKLILPKHILKKHDISILIDADADIKNYSFIKILWDYPFKLGISYIDTLLNHKAKKEFVKDLNMLSPEWIEYKNYVDTLSIDFQEDETIWEYVLVINKKGFLEYPFYHYFEKLQIVKEKIDILDEKIRILAAGEGISVKIAANKSLTPIQRDQNLYNILKDKIKPITRHTPLEEIPKWFK